MKGLIHRVRAVVKLGADSDKAARATGEARELAHRRRELERRGHWPPASALDVASREMLAGNWRPH